MAQLQAALEERQQQKNPFIDSYLEDSNYRDGKQETFLTQQQQQQKAVSMLAKKQAVFNNAEEHKVHGPCKLQAHSLLTIACLNWPRWAPNHRCLQHCSQKQGTFSSQSTGSVTAEQRLVDKTCIFQKIPAVRRNFTIEWHFAQYKGSKKRKKVFSLCNGTDRQKEMFSLFLISLDRGV